MPIQEICVCPSNGKNLDDDSTENPESKVTLIVILHNRQTLHCFVCVCVLYCISKPVQSSLRGTTYVRFRHWFVTNVLPIQDIRKIICYECY